MIWGWESAATSSELGTHGTYLLYRDKAAGRMAINSGPDGMEKVDFLIAEAARCNLRLIIALLDFWSYRGSAQQMRPWYGSTDRNTFFFADRRAESDYRAWAHYILNRVNTQTGIHYKDDPTMSLLD